MTVGELIKKLEQMDQHYKVTLEGGDHTCVEIGSVEVTLADPTKDRGWYHFIQPKHINDHSVYVVVITP